MIFTLVQIHRKTVLRKISQYTISSEIPSGHESQVPKLILACACIECTFFAYIYINQSRDLTICVASIT